MPDDTPTGKRGFDTETERLSYDLAQTRRGLADLRETVEAQAERIAELEQVVSPDPGGADYAGMDREQKVFRLRTTIVRRAMKNGGRAAMDYKEVQSTFGNQPSPGHAYDLMDHAAEAAGFDTDESTDVRRLTVKTEAVNDETVIHAANKTPDAQPA